MLYIFIVNIIHCGTPLTEVVDKKNNHPHILRFENGDEDIPPQYFIVYCTTLISVSVILFRFVVQSLLAIRMSLT